MTPGEAMSHSECPIEGCDAGRATNQLMCKPHWYKVPKELRDKVWRTARRMWSDLPGGDEEWTEARDEAIRAVEEKEAIG